MAATAAQPGRPFLVICGDFALAVSMMKFETAVRHELPILIIVGDNHGNGTRLGTDLL